tara:strand:- start:3670 stop:3855 length:186 start_codon:yes stop_codon:yes gene_type:complete
MNDLDDLVLPANVNDLIKLLTEVYPEKSPRIHEKPENLYFRAGQADVINFILTLKERAENK